VDRIQLVEELLSASRKSAIAQMGFWERPREYAPGDTLYMREAHFIVAVGLEGHPTMSEMARRLNVTQGAVTQTATRLENKGYVVRAKDPKDRRQTTVALTEKGKKLCAEHVRYDQSQYRQVSQWLGDFSDEDLALFIRYEQNKRAMFTTHE